MAHVSPARRKFQALSKTGAGWIDRCIFRSLIHAEEESASEKRKAKGAMSFATKPKSFEQEQSQGRDCYLLDLHPKRRDKLIDGKIWVEKQDIAIAKLSGEPAKSLSLGHSSASGSGI